MMNKDVYPELTDVFQDVFDDETIVLTPEMTADDVDGWDSLAHVRLILAVERAFKVKFSAAQVAHLKNVGDLAALVASRR